MANGNDATEGILAQILENAVGQQAPATEGALGSVAGRATGGQVLDALALSLGLGTATSGGSPFRTSPATTATTTTPSELADTLARFRVRLALSVLGGGFRPQSFAEFIKEGGRRALPAIPAELARELSAVAARPGSTASRTVSKRRGEGVSGFEQAFSTVLPLLVLLGQTGILGGGGAGAGDTAGGIGGILDLIGLGGGTTPALPSNAVLSPTGQQVDVSTGEPIGATTPTDSSALGSLLPALIGLFS